ncbi:hypothetical protein AAMO2058_001574900 [Amorphochlora amoebiformis]|uniref:Uncharacterized protein n=1 Tax=Amorphochlora amoebiformis TaxID=1561963 RepID=A0A6T6WXL4_9EUKA|mmetsp:Transcript_30925/g.49609  ORF Transcript_30925/g.49609 Transcript_30925/m.49609 type:complete len:101 (+) Transcript_30925:238-540(+)
MEMKAKALEKKHDPDEKWEDIHYDLGPCPCRICACFCGTTVDFKDNHITFKSYQFWCLCKDEAEYPYAEVSGVTQNQQCCCCWSITGLHEVRSDSEVVRS